MVGTSDCALRSTARVGNKVSKPLMEKKRRARINKCLDQLKSLLESYYTSNIRKRKLEKADILELTVKHLRSLQKIQSSTSKASEFSDFHAGFSSCLANVNQYLSMVDTINGSDRLAISQLSNNLYCAKGHREESSTLDSDTGTAEARGASTQRLFPAVIGTEARKKTMNIRVDGCFRATKSPKSSSSLNYDTEPTVVEGEHRCFVLKQVIGIIPNNTQANKVLSVCHDSPRNGFDSIQQNMWRPW